MATSPLQRRRLVPLNEAAATWSCHPKTLRRRVADGTLTGYRLPGSRLIRLDLDELEAALRPIPAGDAK